MKSKTQINKQLKRKTNSALVETITELKKHKQWIKVAEILSGSRKNFIDLNLSEINEKIKNIEERKIVVPGKILSQGEVNKDVEIIALDFSENAKKKLLNSKTKYMYIKEGIKKYPGEKIKILEK